MTIKTILLPIRESATADALMETAVKMAIRNNAHLDLLYVQGDPAKFVPFNTFGLSPGMRETILASANAHTDQQAKSLESRFNQLCQDLGMTQCPKGENVDGPSADFLKREGARNDLIGKYGRLNDLIIVPKPARVSPPPSSFEAALRESGRPVMMVPRETVLDHAGKRLALGWNSSKEAAQAISAMKSNLLKAETVFVLCSKKRMANVMNGDDVCTYLKCHGVNAQTVEFDSLSSEPGKALLDKAAELNCDRLVVGGYSRTKIREVTLGGVTSYLLQHADIPVLMVH